MTQGEKMIWAATFARCYDDATRERGILSRVDRANIVAFSYLSVMEARECLDVPDRFLDSDGEARAMLTFAPGAAIPLDPLCPQCESHRRQR